jgi:uncharacterized protein YuzE
MTAPTLHYDEVSDTLSIAFAPGEHATGIELNDHMLLRINRAERRVVGLTILEYSLFAQPTDLGPRSVPLSGLAQLSAELRKVVLDFVQRPPVSEYLALSAYTPSASETIPIVSVRVIAKAA